MGKEFSIMNIIKRRLQYIKKICLINLSSFKKRDPNLYVFGSWFGEKYADNSKYLFKYFLQKGENAYWITKSEDVYNQLKKDGLPVAMAYSDEGKRLCSEAGYIVTSTALSDINENVIGGATRIDLFHGIPLKKIMYDDEVGGKMLTKSQRVHEVLTRRALRDYYVFSSSDTVSQSIRTAFRVDDKHILRYGLPRNDAFFDESLRKIKFSELEYKYVISYLPTHRNVGKTPIPIDKLFNLKKLDEFCRENAILFVIKKHFYHNSEKTDLKGYTNIVDLTGQSYDTQELMFNSDVLITDYSSCYIDYLLLNRPIVFYSYDLEDYLKTDREMYYRYEDVAPGEICTDYMQLYDALNTIVEGGFIISANQERVRDLFFAKENQDIVSDQYYQFMKTHRK